MPGWPKEFLLATSSAGKAEELRALLAEFGVEATIKTYKDFDLSAPAETGTTFIDNARIKAVAGCEATGLPTLADDSGLCVNALNGDPGLYSADWAEHPDGTRDFSMAMDRIDDELGAAEDRSGYFTCTLILRHPDGRETIAEGRVNGTLLPAAAPQGTNGHGYDSWFVPDGFAQSFGEMPSEEKNRLSHRYAAFQNLVHNLR